MPAIMIELVIGATFFVLSCVFAFWLFFYENPLKRWRENFWTTRAHRRLSKIEEEREFARMVVRDTNYAVEYHTTMLLWIALSFGMTA